MEGMEDMNLDEQYILSDPESEWKQEKESTCSTEDEDSDRPESDQPYIKLEHVSKLSTTWRERRTVNVKFKRAADRVVQKAL